MSRLIRSLEKGPVLLYVASEGLYMARHRSEAVFIGRRLGTGHHRGLPEHLARSPNPSGTAGTGRVSLYETTIALNILLHAGDPSVRYREDR